MNEFKCLLNLFLQSFMLWAQALWVQKAIIPLHFHLIECNLFRSISTGFLRAGHFGVRMHLPKFIPWLVVVMSVCLSSKWRPGKREDQSSVVLRSDWPRPHPNRLQGLEKSWEAFKVEQGQFDWKTCQNVMNGRMYISNKTPLLHLLIGLTQFTTILCTRIYLGGWRLEV